MCKKHIPGEYQCSICGKRHVRLWWPEDLERPFFVCADCCEKLQSPCYRFKKIGTSVHGLEKFETEPTRMQPEWKIGDDGTIPLYERGNKTGKKTSSLIVDLSEYFPDSVFTNEALVVPAVRTPEMDGAIADAFPYDEEEWKALPTR